MSDSKPQSSLARNPRIAGRQSALRLCLVLVCLLICAPAIAADAEPSVEPRPDGAEMFGGDTPLGRVGYVAGRGLRVGKTGLTIGGFATANAERLEGGESSGGVEGVNFLLSFDPVPFVHLFSEIEVSQLATLQSDREGVRSDPGIEVDRLYADLGGADALQLRFGKFLTPFGRWNQAPVEPLVWTTSEPLIVEEVFDETTTGAMLWGSLFPRSATLSYAIYGSFLDPIAPDREAPPAEHSAGGRIEWASLAGWTVGASYFASERPHEWNHLGGLDALWRPHDRIELSGEALFGEGPRGNGAQWGLFAQGVVEMVPTLYAVARYERFEPARSGRAVDLFTVGLTWEPVHYLRLKVDYRFADRLDELSAPGLRSSFSVLF